MRGLHNCLSCLCLFLLTIPLLGCGSGAASKGPPAAPDFTLRTPRGKALTLSQYQGLPVVINFFTTWCGPCRSEMPGIQRVYTRYAPDGLVVIGVDVEESAAEVSGYAKEVGLSFPLVLDTDGSVASLYRVNAFPRTFFIHPDGSIARTVSGSMRESDFAAYVAELMEMPRMPTATPTTLFRAVDAAENMLEGCVAIKLIYVRTAPSKNADSPFTYGRETCLAFDGRTTDGKWLRLGEQASHDGKRLWVSAGSFDLKGDLQKLPVVE